ncbi:MAG: allantoate amidohydrolase [Nonomuraea muscovyensis]|nr:allantoate amidohydrolase [Nonomuraea muscovyensis]
MTDRTPDGHALPATDRTPDGHALPATDRTPDGHALPATDHTTDQHTPQTERATIDQHALQNAERTATDLRRRFEQVWEALARVGDGGAAGYHRFAWTPVDLALRGWFEEQAARRGMTYERDRNGNQWAWWGPPGPGAVVTGSHLDSVPGGGAFDGPLGVVSAFLAVDELRERGVTPARPLAVVNFTDEEGARFGVACVGSRLLTGVLSPADARELRDADGVTLAEAMRAAGADPGALGRDEEALARIGAFVELHIEQGRGLADLDAPVGVASAIWPHGRWRCTFHGEANHAGTTRLADRHDPMLPFASTVLAARDSAERLGALATFGKVRLDPNGTNAIPSRVDAWLDGRAPDAETVRAMVAEITDAACTAAAGHGVRVEVVAESTTPVVRFGDELRDRIVAVLGGVPALPTGAGHDAGILSASVPSAMIFVRNPTGVSHSPAEHAGVDDCVAGVAALASVLEQLACR